MRDTIARHGIAVDDIYSLDTAGLCAPEGLMSGAILGLLDVVTTINLNLSGLGYTGRWTKSK